MSNWTVLLASGFLTLAATAAHAGNTGVVCQWGIAGLNGSDPEMLLGAYGFEVEFKAGTTDLADQGKSTLAMEEYRESQVQVTPLGPGETEQFKFSFSEKDLATMEVSVSRQPFTGRFAGLSPEGAKLAVASMITFKFPQGDSQQLPGFCVVVK